MKNKNIAVFGAFYGDEAKARFCHWSAKDFDYFIRFSGSSNCGHTIYDNNVKIVRHLIPSADFNFNKAFLGSGMVINPDELLKEVEDTIKLFPDAATKIIVDPDAFVVFPKHIEEDMLKNKHIGSTNKGVSPAYRDKINRCGTKIRDILNNSSIKKLIDLGVQFKYSLEMKEEFQNSKLLFEGGQSILLDYNFSAYPFCTSGECSLGGIYNAGFAFAPPEIVYGIFKAYSTKVGEGPFPTEYFDDAANKIRKIGNEIGATTKRPRRIGALDLPALKYSVIKGGINSLVMTKLDVLNGESTIKICTGYEKPIYSGSDFFTAKPIYIDLPGWKDSKNLEEIKPLIQYVEKYIGISISYISTGVNPEDLIKL